MFKKDIKAIFQAIRHRDAVRVMELLDSKPELIAACNFAPPKKDDGQSTLQVAFKVGAFDIAKLLIDRGADVNFMEQSDINEWRAPVLHDCIRAVVFNSHTLQRDGARFKEGMEVFRSMLERGAEVGAYDSFNNNCLHRLLLDSAQMINHPNADIEAGVLLPQLRSIAEELLARGADPDESSDERGSARELEENFRLTQYGLLRP